MGVQGSIYGHLPLQYVTVVLLLVAVHAIIPCPAHLRGWEQTTSARLVMDLLLVEVLVLELVTPSGMEKTVLKAIAVTTQAGSVKNYLNPQLMISVSLQH